MLGALAGELGFLASSLFSLTVYIVTVLGIYRMSRGLGHHVAVTIILTVAGIIPYFNLIIMIVLSIMGTTRLRTAGYKVGFLGARKKPA